ncbi:MAG TPA: response regulator [Actinomycetota bacterium]|nr:response regulator [Actinomycetota bacterium]
MKRKAVVVEMDDGIAGMICYFLELQGITCSAVTNAEEGLDLLETAHADMAIIDAALPGHDGWWLVEELRHTEERPRLPVVLLTRQHDTESRADRLACECLGKPFSYDELNERLSAAALRCTVAATADE